jgi:Zn-dependent protease with chaperone function
MIANRTKKLYDIDPGSWEHPADRAALAALRGIHGLDDIIKFVFGKTSERSIRLLHIASAARVTQNQFPKINMMLDRILDVFDWDYRPEVFVAQSPFFNAGVYGVEQPFIVINSVMPQRLDDQELECVLAHEMGHLLSGHAVYKTLLWLLLNASSRLVPGSDLVIMPIVAALREWDRKSELSADRAALLATQNLDTNYTVLMKMAGGDDVSQLNMNDFFAQAAEYENSSMLLDGIHKVLNTVWESHPFPVIRLQELRTWAASGQYEAILQGNYLKRGFHKADHADEIRQGFEFYRSELGKGEDPVSRTARAVGDGLSKLGDDVNDAIKRLFG